MTREIVLDTETTGLSYQTGDRIVEIGCVELINHVPTGNHLHIYINPERDMPEEAFRVHGLSSEFLADKPKFAEEAQNFVDFIGDAALVIHNAPFDMGFLNGELQACGRPKLSNQVIDTVIVARERHPGARVSLDALCKHYGIDNSRRVLHGALLDSEILADVYLELIGGRQVALALGGEARTTGGITVTRAPARQRPQPLPSRLSSEELAAHRALVGSLGEDSLWAGYREETAA
ncbi:DNA polymerase III subunit epsilon [Devosia sp.]|uniref:DNA polymerase III subunit epsilon n=1 Tax=Devosia sp. TaxID=1871048 RepID=UPI003A917905